MGFSVYAHFKTIEWRDCKRNFEWPSMQQSSIHNGILDTFDGLSSREIFMFKRISKTVCFSKTLLYAVVQSWFKQLICSLRNPKVDRQFHVISLFKHLKVNFHVLSLSEVTIDIS